MSGTSGQQSGLDSTTHSKTVKAECNDMHELDKQSSWEAQKSLLWQALPLALLLIISVLVQNIVSILFFIAFIVTFDCVNDGVVKESERSRGIYVFKTIFLMVYMAGCIFLSYPMASNYWLFTITSFTHWWSSGSTFWSTILVVIVVDYLFKFITMILKCGLLLLSGTILPKHKRGRIFMACEGVSQMFRCLLPIPEWARYILTCEICLSKVLCWLLLGLYVYLKVKALKKKMMIVVSAWRYGTVTSEKLQTADSQDISTLQDVKLCPICHENHLDPMKLPCGHIFCKNCISIWFDREQHCPKCASDAINSLVLGFQASLPPLMHYTSSNNKWKTGCTDYVIQFF